MSDRLLESERTYARAWTPQDAETALGIYGDPQVTRWLGRDGKPWAKTVEEMRSVLERWQASPPYEEPYGFWALVERQSDTPVGSVLLAPIERKGPEIEVGWHLGRAHWGNGFATESAREAIRFGFDVVGLERIVAVVNAENEASRRVAGRLGMRHEGRRFFYERDLEYYVLDRAGWS